MLLRTCETMPERTLVLETNGRRKIEELTREDWLGYEGIAVGGASFTFPPSPHNVRINIGRPCLIGDQALGIALALRKLRLG